MLIKDKYYNDLYKFHLRLIPKIRSVNQINTSLSKIANKLYNK